jgi:P27 family predicted phage terminase small subunit
MRGRKPKPFEIQQLEGDTRKIGKRKLEERIFSQTTATAGLPECPKHLKGLARRAWTFWAGELEAMEMDRRPDAMALEGACVNYSRAVDADALLARVGLVIEEPILDRDTGELIGTKVKAHPATTISNRAWSQVRAFCGEFGFTPVSRVRLPAVAKQQSDDLMSLLTQPREQREAVSTVQ